MKTSHGAGFCVPNMIIVKLICCVNVENHFLSFKKHITLTRIILGTPLLNKTKSLLDAIFLSLLLLREGLKKSDFYHLGG